MTTHTEVPSDKPLIDVAEDLGFALDELKATGKGRRQVVRLAQRTVQLAAEILRWAERGVN